MNLLFKLSWMFLLIACFSVNPFVLAQDIEGDDEEEDVTDEDRGDNIGPIIGNGSEESNALADAWINGMKKFLKANLDSKDFEANKNGIEGFLIENWTLYCVDDCDKPTKKNKFNRNKGTIKIVEGYIDGKTLLKDINLKFTEARDRFQGFKVVLLPDKDDGAHTVSPGSCKNEKLDCDVMYDTLSDKLTKNFEVYDLKAIMNAMKEEALATGTTAADDPEAYAAKKYQAANMFIYVWVSTHRLDHDALSGAPVWTATISFKMVHRQTGKIIAQFQAPEKIKGFSVIEGAVDDRMARQNAVKYAAEDAVKKIVHHASLYKTNMPDPSIYQVKFLGLDPTQTDKIHRAISQLKEGQRPSIRLKKGGETSTSTYISFIIKWLKNDQPQEQVARTIRETCKSNGVYLKEQLASPGQIVFQKYEPED